MPLVPQFQVGGSGEKGGSTGLVEMMLSMLVADRAGLPKPAQQNAPTDTQ